MNKKKGITLVAIAAIMLAAGTTVSLAPMNVLASSGGSSDGDDEPALNMETERSNPSGDRGGTTTSDDNSENSAVKKTIERNHDVKGASSAGSPALDLTIETPHSEKNIISADESQAAKSQQEDSYFSCFAAFQACG